MTQNNLASIMVWKMLLGNIVLAGTFGSPVVNTALIAILL